MCGGEGFTQSTFEGRNHFCPMCSGCLQESYLICVFLFSICTLGFCFHNFMLFTILLSIFFFFLREKLLENCSLLAVIFHMEYNINFLFSIVATYARMEIPCMLYF